ncbi:extracellular solute-binding protein [Hahella sp. NBU794]|uniref:extracellular solute-binding protein n=1 Tax=Hahella sp. NBU794 TaxID=3422590 RepID=UPI003D6F0966
MIRSFVLLLLCAVSLVCYGEPEVITAKGIALRGEPKYPDDFTHFDYVNPDAPKGGTIRLHSIGTYDNFNRYAQRGTSGAGADELYDSLLIASQDEIEVYYPLIAEKIEFASDYSWIIFHINPKATFQDHKPITAQDVKFSFEKFANEGVPQFKKYYSFITSIEVLDEHQVKFSMKDANREQMFSLFSLKILPEHYWASRNFGDPIKDVPLGSSGVTISDYSYGQYVVVKTLDDYWGKDLPVNKGRNNITYTRYDYYRDATVAFEAFKSGEFDFWQEGEAKNWATAYNFPAIKNKLVKKEELAHSIPQSTTGFVYNTERPIFKDRRVRKALSYLLDFEWMNKALFYGQYVRTTSYFTNTPYSTSGLPSEAELEILNPLKDQLPPEVFEKPFKLPVTNGDGYIRDNIRIALQLLKEAGWELRDGKTVNAKTGQQMEFELLSYSPTTERSAAPLRRNLEKIGIIMNLRQVDPSQYINRVRTHDFDMVSFRYPALSYPSSDLKILFHSSFVDSTWNSANLRDPAVDAIVEGIEKSQEDPDKLLVYGHALDRVLLWKYLMIPQWHLSAFRIAYWDKFSRPETRPKYDLGQDTWWFDKDKAAQLGR